MLWKYTVHGWYVQMIVQFTTYYTNCFDDIEQSCMSCFHARCHNRWMLFIWRIHAGHLDHMAIEDPYDSNEPPPLTLNLEYLKSLVSQSLGGQKAHGRPLFCHAVFGNGLSDRRLSSSSLACQPEDLRIVSRSLSWRHGGVLIRIWVLAGCATSRMANLLVNST